MVSVQPRKSENSRNSSKHTRLTSSSCKKSSEPQINSDSSSTILMDMRRSIIQQKKPDMQEPESGLPIICANMSTLSKQDSRVIQPPMSDESLISSSSVMGISTIFSASTSPTEENLNKPGKTSLYSMLSSRNGWMSSVHSDILSSGVVI